MYCAPQPHSQAPRRVLPSPASRFPCFPARSPLLPARRAQRMPHVSQFRKSRTAPPVSQPRPPPPPLPSLFAPQAMPALAAPPTPASHPSARRCSPDAHAPTALRLPHVTRAVLRLPLRVRSERAAYPTPPVLSPSASPTTLACATPQVHALHSSAQFCRPDARAPAPPYELYASSLPLRLLSVPTPRLVSVSVLDPVQLQLIAPCTRCLHSAAPPGAAP